MITRFEIRWRGYWKVLFFQTWRGYHQIKWVFVRSWRYYGTSTVRYYWNPCIHIHVHTLIYLRFWYVKCWYFLEWEISKDIIWRLFHPLFYWSACNQARRVSSRVYMNSPLPPLIMPPFLLWKSGLIRGVSFLEGDNLVVFYYLIGNLAW